jgi:hypothetical protein
MSKISHVGLWLDKIGDPENPAWIVSLDTRDDRGEVETSTTESIHPEDDYSDAHDEALSLARERSLPLIKTDQYGVAETLYRPED